MIETIDTLAEQNQSLREAVEARRGGCCEGSQPCPTIDTRGPINDPDDDELEESAAIPADWILRGERELKREREADTEPRLTGDSLLKDDTPPAERLLLTALDTIRQRRGCYGGPRDHFRRTIGMINAAFSHVLTRPLTEADWAIFMTLDKVARYCGPAKTTDGPVDLAGYAACLAEVESP